MTLLGDLCEVFDANIDDLGLTDEEYPLAPVGYTQATVHIKINLDLDGNFLGAQTYKAKQQELIPCTVDSGVRSSNIAPHALHDKLIYVAGDIEKHGISLKKNKKGDISFLNYLHQLQEWAESPEAVKGVKAIYKYVSKQSLIKDLVAANVLYVDDNNVLVDKWPGNSKDPEKNEIFKIITTKQSDAFIYFQILNGETDKNLKLIRKSWTAYYKKFLETNGHRGLDYITGQNMILLSKHAQYIRNSRDQAKLISSNDSQGFTYRGRFLNAEQAAAIGYESSNKAFNALKWLIKKQGYIVNDRVFVVWGERGEKEPLPVDSRGRAVPMEDPTDVNFFQKQFKTFLKGYSKNLESNRQIHLLVLDAATPGRMDLVYYQSYDQNYYFDQIKRWYEGMTIEVVTKGKVYQEQISLMQLVYAAYGKRVSDSMKAETIMRLVRCVTDSAKEIPSDLRKQVVHRAGAPLADSSSESNWSETVKVMVAINQKYYGKEEIPMTLDVEDKDRNYLFGRLLAVADKVELDVLNKRFEKRPTAAMRYMNAFEQRPDSTWQNIHRLLLPYFASNESRDYYQKLIAQIMDGIDEHETYNQPLNAKYLTGYYHQKNNFYVKKRTEQMTLREDKNDDKVEK